VLRSHPEVTIAELACQLNLSNSGVEYNLRKLRQEGRIRREGSTKAGRWVWFPRSLAACESLLSALCHSARSLSHERNRQRSLLQIQEVQATPRVEVHPRRLVLFIRPQSSLQKPQSILAAWYREELRKEALPLIDSWQDRLHVRCNKLFIQAMSRPTCVCRAMARRSRCFSMPISRIGRNVVPC
jgi:hypothetical protein